MWLGGVACGWRMWIVEWCISLIWRQVWFWFDCGLGRVCYIWSWECVYIGSKCISLNCMGEFFLVNSVCCDIGVVCSFSILQLTMELIGEFWFSLSRVEALNSILFLVWSFRCYKVVFWCAYCDCDIWCFFISGFWGPDRSEYSWILHVLV